MKLSLNYGLYAILIFITVQSSQLLAQEQNESDNSAVEQEYTEEEKAYIEWANGVMERLEPQTGLVQLPNGKTEIQVQEGFVYFNPEQAEIILSEVWGNPPGQMTEGLLMPDHYTPFDSDAWAVTVEYENDGHVSDEDASEIDYSDLLESMQDDTRAANSQRQQMGYPAIELVRWASAPYYDANTHKLHWAKELKFEESEENTLNYNVRVLGREGVLVLNFIAGMNQLPEIQNKIESVMGMANFKTGQTYDDFDSSVDKVAAYGIGALVAGKVLSKAGFFAAALIFLKKFWFIFAIAIAGVFQFVKGRFSSKEANQDR
ncbi:MAG: DUF2167 domain-containing protein [Gammaproteobacteria bacterium]|nr:DUF2167 domain-containing protein [Gammaproteobacteria bacterium]